MKERQRAKLNREKDISDPLKYARVKELNRLRYIIFLNFFLHFCSCSLIVLRQKEMITKNAVVQELISEREDFNDLLTVIR